MYKKLEALDKITKPGHGVFLCKAWSFGWDN
jgi:hypothetical protein